MINVQLSFDLMESWLARNPDAIAFKEDGVSVFRELALFQDYHGLPAFKSVSSCTSDDFLIRIDYQN